MSSELLELDKARMRLAWVWFIGSGCVFLVLLVQSMLQAYAGQLEDVWAWFSTSILPMLALMVMVFKGNAIVRRKKGQREVPDERPELFVRQLPYHITLGLSVFYLVTALASILAIPLIMALHTSDHPGAEAPAGAATDLLTSVDSLTRADALLLSHRWLGVLQTLVVSALGALFFTQQPDE